MPPERFLGARPVKASAAGSGAIVSGPFHLIVTDTSPLITLALADALEALLRPGIPVSIPDAVYIEATRVRSAAGASRIVEWMNDHLDRVRIVPTEVGVDQLRRIEEGRTIRALGEQAALEVLERFMSSNPEAEALLLFEDSDIARRRAIVDERVSLISTGDFLRELEAAHLIQSADCTDSFSRCSSTSHRAFPAKAGIHMWTAPVSQGVGSCDGSGRLRSYVRPVWCGRRDRWPRWVTRIGSLTLP